MYLWFNSTQSKVCYFFESQNLKNIQYGFQQNLMLAMWRAHNKLKCRTKKSNCWMYFRNPSRKTPTFAGNLPLSNLGYVGYLLNLNITALTLWFLNAVFPNKVFIGFVSSSSLCDHTPLETNLVSCPISQFYFLNSVFTLGC